jgi:nucleoside-diphosphate-sugar epimerase
MWMQIGHYFLLMKNKYLITGASGFIGSNIVKTLVKQKHEIVVIVRDKKTCWRLKDVASQITIIESDLRGKAIERILDKVKPHYIFHLAAYGMPPQEDNIYDMIDFNLKGAINLLNAAKKNPFKLFVNTGSCLEYGNKHNPLKETDVLEPMNDYSVIKSAFTLYSQKEAVRNKLPIITLRLFTPYGYAEDAFRLIPSVIRSALANEPIKVSTPKSVRDFIFIEDVVNAYIQVTKKTLPPGEIYNIGSGKEHSIGEIVKLSIKLSKSNSDVLWGAVKKQTRYVEPGRLEADLSKSKRLLKWEPKYTIEQGLEKTIQWFQKYDNLYHAKK